MRQPNAPHPAFRLARCSLGQLLVGLGFFSVTSVVPAQEPPAAAETRQTFGSTLEVNEVEMEVYAVDREGGLVEDLRADELRLRQDGRQGEITALRLVRTRDPAPRAGGGEAASREPVEAPAAERAPLHLVVFVDTFDLDPFHRHRALGEVYTFLDQHLAPGDRVMVATYAFGLRVVSPFTSDRRKILAALREADASAAPLLSPRHEEQRLMQEIQNIQQSMLAGRFGDACTIIEDLARNHGAARHQEVRRAAQALESFVTSLTGLEGRKAVLHLSDGIPLIAGLAPLEYVKELCDGSGVRRGVAFAIDMSLDPHDHVDPQRIDMALSTYDTTTLWTRLAAHANLLGVTFYTLHAGGLEAVDGGGADVGARLGSLETRAAEQRNRLDTLVALAEDTGGRAVVNRNDLAAALGEITRDLRSYYLLSFRPPAAAAGTVYRVRLETTRPGVRLRYRRSYRFRTEHEQIADRLVATILHGAGANPLGVNLTTSRAEPAGDGQRPLRLRLSVPLAQLSLVTQGEEAQGLFTVFVGVLRGDGAVSPVRQSSLPVVVPLARLGSIGGQAYIHEIEIILPEGEHVVGVGVLDEMGGGSSLVRAKVKI